MLFIFSMMACFFFRFSSFSSSCCWESFWRFSFHHAHLSLEGFFVHVGSHHVFLGVAARLKVCLLLGFALGEVRLVERCLQVVHLVFGGVFFTMRQFLHRKSRYDLLFGGIGLPLLGRLFLLGCGFGCFFSFCCGFGFGFGDYRFGTTVSAVVGNFCRFCVFYWVFYYFVSSN